MIQTVAPTLPRRLYRYRRVQSADLLNREMDAIRNNYIWCSNFEALNDPMEGIFRLTPTAANMPNGHRIPSAVIEVMIQMGVCCFSDTCENDIMWAHYAGECSGICIAYSAHDLRDGLSGVWGARVQYDIQSPILSDHETLDLEHAAIKALSSKKEAWSYEREWRLLTKPLAVNAPGKLQIQGQNPVKGILFGSRTDSRVIDAVRASLNGVRNDSIKYYEPVLTRGTYRYEWKEIS
jgi:hypothetical protein